MNINERMETIEWRKGFNPVRFSVLSRKKLKRLTHQISNGDNLPQTKYDMKYLFRKHTGWIGEMK